jgi:hypothetical protein
MTSMCLHAAPRRTRPGCCRRSPGLVDVRATPSTSPGPLATTLTVRMAVAHVAAAAPRQLLRRASLARRVGLAAPLGPLAVPRLAAAAAPARRCLATQVFTDEVRAVTSLLSHLGSGPLVCFAKRQWRRTLRQAAAERTAALLQQQQSEQQRRCSSRASAFQRSTKRTYATVLRSFCRGLCCRRGARPSRLPTLRRHWQCIRPFSMAL